MVVLQRIGFILSNQCFEMPILRLPSILVGSPNAGCIWDCLWEQKFFATVRERLESLQSHAQLKIFVREPDAASVGLRTLHFELAEIRRKQEIEKAAARPGGLSSLASTFGWDLEPA